MLLHIEETCIVSRINYPVGITIQIIKVAVYRNLFQDTEISFLKNQNLKDLL